jgi:hypothetical protein
VERRTRLLVLIRALAGGLAATALAASSAGARTLESRDAALARVFGAGVRFEPRTVYLTTAQKDSVRARAGARFEVDRFTYWRALRRDSLLGTAFLETEIVRTMPATWLVAVTPQATVRSVEILAFHEPEDYMPRRRWLDRLAGRLLHRRLRPGDGVDGITGATLSARAACDTVRRSLALAAFLGEAEP